MPQFVQRSPRRLRLVTDVVGLIAVAAALAGWPLGAACAADAAAKADEVDTEHIFGFTEGSDIGEKGEKELEVEAGMAIGKRSGAYYASSSSIFYKYSITDDLRIAPSFALLSHAISGVPGLNDRSEVTLGGVGGEIRYKLLDRAKAPAGVTLSVEPFWNRVDETSGNRVSQSGLGIAALIDKELVPATLFGALHVGYEPQWSHDNRSGQSAQESALDFGAALSMRVSPRVFVGAEVRYMRVYDGIGLDDFGGDALFLGPTMFVKLAKEVGLTAAWNAQVAGHAAGESGRLNLNDFERHQVLLRLSVGLE